MGEKIKNFQERTEIFFKSLKNLSFLFFLIVFMSLGQSVNSATLTVKQGEILIYPITSETNTSAYFGGQKIPVFNYEGNNYALVSADVSKKIGDYYLRIKVDTKEIEKKLISVKLGNYKKVLRKVPYKIATLPKAEQEMVAQDKAPLLALLKQAIVEPSPRLWQSIFMYPLGSLTTTSPFGYKRIYTNRTTIHRGVDLRADIGTPVYAISEGKVLWGEGKALYLEGPMVAIDHGEGIVSEYLHLSKVLVQTGGMVKAGDVIGYTGNEGADVAGAHLHFAIKIKNAYVNPLQFISEIQKLENNP